MTESLIKCWEEVRQRSLAIAALLSAEDASVQSMPDASPTKWHLAHTTWFFETFIFETMQPQYQPFNPAFRKLFNSYYNGIGEQFARPHRGLLTRPDLNEILSYREVVDQAVRQLFQQHPSPQLNRLIELGIQHEQQHQELMLTDIKHLFSCNPLYPALLVEARNEVPSPSGRGVGEREQGRVKHNGASFKQRFPLPPFGHPLPGGEGTSPFSIYDTTEANEQPMSWQHIESNLVEIGYQGEGFCFDNETPRHREFVEDFFIASRLVTNSEYWAFIEAGGYQNPSLWLADGWNWVQQECLQHPLYWRQGTDTNLPWCEFTLYGLVEIDPIQPVSHLSFFEACAYATWVGARLPTEAEWEVAAQQTQLQQLFDSCWQWTSSSYSPYPRYVPTAGALGEYNGKFMANQYVLRGSSAFTPTNHSRVTYRNFFPATARWQRSGIRLAKSNDKNSRN